MILTCPACATSYFVPDNAIGTSGRRVRCKSCGNDWRATSDDAPLDLGDIAAATSPGLNSPNDVEQVEEEQIPQALPQAFRARAEQKRRTQSAIKQGLAWGLTGVLVLIGLLSAYLWRDSIVARVPKLASAYQAVGVSTNPFGLDFEAISTGFARNDVSQVYVSGAIRNLRDRELVPPSILVRAFDAEGREITQRVVKLDTAPVLPGGVQGFAVVLPNTDGRFAEAAVSFIRSEAPPAAKPADKSKAAPRVVEPQSAAAPPAKSAAKAAPPAPAAATKASSSPATPAQKAEGDDGLRRISQLAPTPNGRTDLDIGHRVGVSAGNG